MTDKQTTLKLDLDGNEVALTIVRATARMGMARWQLIFKGERDNENETDEARKALRVMGYPDMITATVAAEGIPWPISFDEFVELPEVFYESWSEMVYSMNPQWRPGIIPAEDVKKKAKNSESG
jgi:hypothetical protein